MIKAVIVEDEPKCIKRLSRLLREHCENDVKLLASYTTVKDALIGIRHYQPDLLFLDVEIQDETGFDLLNDLKDTPVEVIFTTAFEEYALRAIKFSAIDFLIKPIDPDELVAAVHKMQKRSVKPDLLAEMWKTLIQNTQNKHEPPEKLLLSDGNGWEVIKLMNIIQCKSTGDSGNNTLVILDDKRQFLVTRTLKDFAALLTDVGFHRIHKSHLINMNHIKEYIKKDIQKYKEDDVEVKIEKYDLLLMNNGEKIHISNDEKPAFMERMRKFTLSLKRNDGKT